MQKVYFREEQQFDLVWIRLPFLFMAVGGTLVFGFGLYLQLFLGIQWGDHPMNNTDLVILSAIVVFVLWAIFLMFYLARLSTIITDEDISFKFPPFQIKTLHISMNSINRFEIRRYRPLREFGGYGAKDSLQKKGKGYIAQGNQGLQIYLNDGKLVLLGTQKPDSLKLAMERMMNHNELR